MTEQTSRLAIILDSSGAEKQADSLTVALDKMTQSGDKAVTSIFKVTKATDEEKEALNKLRAAIDPVGAAINTVGRRFSELKKYFDQGLIDEEEFRSLSKMLNDTTEELSGVAQAQREAKKAGELAAAQQEAQAQAFQRMLDKIDPLSSALRNLDQQQSELNKAFESEKINASQYDSYSKKLQETRREVTGAAQAEREAAKAHDEQVAALRRLEAQIDPVGEAFRRLNEQQRQLDSAKATGMLSPLAYERLNSKLAESRDALEKTQTQLGKTGQSAAQTANAMRMIPAQMTDIVVGLSTGQSPFMVLMQQGGQLKDMFGGIGPAIKGVGGYVAGLINPFTLAAAAIGVLGLAYYNGSQEQDEFYKSLTMTGNLVGKTSGQLADMADRVSVAANSTTGAAASTLNQLVSSGKVAGDSLERVTTAIVKTSDATGIATDKLVGDFNDIAADPVAAITKLNDQYHFLTLATYNQIKALQDEGNQQEAARVATDAYANTMQQRANDIHQNLGLLESAWDSLGKAAKSAWDQMLNVGREKSLEERLSEAQAKVKNSTAGYTRDIWGNVTGLSRDANADVNILQSVIDLQTDLTKGAAKANAAEQQRIKTQQEADRVNQQYLSNADRRNKAIKQQNEFLKSGAITAEQYAKNVSRINEMYKDPAQKKQKAYTEDAATRLLDQINQQTAAMQSQLDASDKLNSATQARVKFEQQIADLKSKTQLTADQKSILSRSDEILQAYKQQEALQNSVKTLDDYRKMQEQIAPKEVKQNDILQKRLQILQEMVRLGKLKKPEANKQASDLIASMPLPNSVISAVNKTGGTLTSGATSHDMAGQGLNMIGLQVDPQLDVIEKLKRAQIDYAEWMKVQNRLIAQDSILTEQQKADRLMEIRNNQQTLEAALYVAQAQSAQNSFSLITDSMGTMFGEQSAMYKAAFVTQKAFAIAQAALQLPMAMGQALAGLPFPANLAAIAQVVGLMSTITSSISSAALTGMAHNGIDSIPSTGTWLLEKGERVMTADTSAKLDSTLENLRKNGLDATLSKPGFGTGVQNVSSSQKTVVHAPIVQNNNLQGITPEQLSSTLNQNNGLMSKQLSKQIKSEMAGEVISPKGEFGKALKSRYVRGYKE